MPRIRILEAAALASAVLALLGQPACSAAQKEGRDLDEKPLVIGKDEDPQLDNDEGLVKGFFRDAETKLPIPQVEMTVSALSGHEAAQQLAMGNEKGRANAVVPVGRYRVFARVCNYAPQAVDLEVLHFAPALASMFLKKDTSPANQCPAQP